MHAVLGERMIEIEHHGIGLEFHYQAVDTETVGRLQWYQIAGSEHLLIEFAVDKQVLTGYGVDILLRIGSESLVGLGVEIEFKPFS